MKAEPAEDKVREIQVQIISAEELTDVKHVTKMRPYAVVYVEQDFHVAKTRVDEEGGVNPRWDEMVKVRFHEKLLEDGADAALNVDVYAHGHIREKLVGSTRVHLSDVLKVKLCGEEEAEAEAEQIQCTTVRLWKRGKSRGVLNLWVPPSEKDKEETAPVVEEEDVGRAAATVEVTPEMIEEKLGEQMVLFSSRAHSAMNLSVLGNTIDRSSSV